MGISPKLARAWDDAYLSAEPTDWEKLGLADLASFIERRFPTRQGEVTSILEIGCGRGYKTLLLVLKLFNTPTTNVLGLDISRRAIAAAEECRVALTRGDRPGALAEYLDALKIQLPLTANVRFQVADFLNFVPPSADEQYDVVIDWMCFHELPPLFTDEYARKVRALTRKAFVLKVFSGSPSPVPWVPENRRGVRKHRFTREEIEEIFSSFTIFTDQNEPGVEKPIPAHSDGPAAAKQAYILLPKCVA